MSRHQGNTAEPVLAQLFAMIIDCRLASWPEEHGVRARGRPGFGRTIAQLTAFLSLGHS